MQLERTVARLVARLGDEAPDSTPGNLASDLLPASDSVIDVPPTSDEISMVDPHLSNVNHHQKAVDSAGPVFVIRDVATEVGMGQHNQRATGTTLNDGPEDVIIKGLLTVKDATSLLKMHVRSNCRLMKSLTSHRFLEHYGRWVAFRNDQVENLLAEVRRSPLLLCACCLIAVRHTTEDLAAVLAPRMFEEAKSLFSKALLAVPQSFDFFQASVILSMWSTTIGQVLLSIDSWLSSGFALQHSFASDIFTSTNGQGASQATGLDTDQLAVWNNLCLTHLQYCS